MARSPITPPDMNPKAPPEERRGGVRRDSPAPKAPKGAAVIRKGRRR